MDIKRVNGDVVKMTPSQMKKELENLDRQVEILLSGGYCPMCDRHLSRDKFYISYDANMKSGISPICSSCAGKIARRQDADGHYHEPTKSSVMEALEYLDKPFLNTIWDASYFEYNSPGNRFNSIWAAYMKNIQMPQYRGKRWRDGDIFKTGFITGQMDAALPSSEENKIAEMERQKMLEAKDDYEKNRKDVIKMVGYDPFDNYPREDDKPHLYASLVSMIDEETKEDGMKLRAVIQIVQSHNQIRKINDAINLKISSPENIFSELPVIEKAQRTVKGMVDSANALAKDNGISANFNNNKSKGANTLSGKIKELTERNFSGVDINTFDIETCEGMKQVAILSETARHNQIGYSEDIAQEIKDIKVDLVETLTKERDAAKETSRLLLDENNKLKRFLREKGLIDDNNQVIYE